MKLRVSASDMDANGELNRMLEPAKAKMHAFVREPVGVPHRDSLRLKCWAVALGSEKYTPQEICAMQILVHCKNADGRDTACETDALMRKEDAD